MAAVLEAPRRAQSASQFAIGFGVVNELFLVWVPTQFALQMERAPGELADGIRADGDVDMGDRFLPRADAFEEVPLVKGAHGQADLIGANWIRK